MSTEDAGTGLLGLTGRQRLIVLYVAILAWICVLLYATRGWGFKDYLFPRLVGSITFLLGLGKLVSLYAPGLVERLVPDTEESFEFIDRFSEEDDRSTGEQQRAMLKMIAWVVSLPVLLYVFGYVYVIPVYLFAFVWYYVDLRYAAAVTVVFSVVMYLLFVQLLGITLWQGILRLPLPGFL